MVGKVLLVYRLLQKEALDKFGQALTEFLQSTLYHAQEKQNADPEQ